MEARPQRPGLYPEDTEGRGRGTARVSKRGSGMAGLHVQESPLAAVWGYPGGAHEATQGRAEQERMGLQGG